ncbi:Uncharacterized membrane protein [Enhydrobacter aerosaccus]|uniref:Uncharacterized membrane protein n=1 Tax=Enhydrobacter aerosaccus TaxID=225324 RepID=A0A1T4Q9D1_9HYPH|nr:DUF1269 domain-containing protein [Enhydrobacter aerosaccus]SKA00246.1 Uncharacterized membrane protein [Enhydrobacter aerosaccus]
MNDLVLIAFPSEAQAEEVRTRILALQKKYLIEVGDAVIAVRDAKGHVKLNQMVSLTGSGASNGAMWGLITGALFAMPAVGVAAGAAVGAVELAAAALPGVAATAGAVHGLLADVGIPDAEMREQARALKPGEAGLFLLIRKMTADRVLADLAGVGGRVVRTSFDAATEKALRAALAEHVAATS